MPQPPRVTGRGGGANAAGVRYLLAGAQAWHAQAEACTGQMSAVSSGLRIAMMASGQHAQVDSVAPDAPRVSAALEDVRRQYPPRRLRSATLDPSFAEAVVQHSSEGSASRSCAPGGGGGGVAHPSTSGPPVPSNLHGCYLYIFTYEYMYKYPASPPPPRHGLFDRHVGYYPRTLRNFLRHCLYFSWGILCPLICYTADCVSSEMMTIGLGVW